MTPTGISRREILVGAVCIPLSACTLPLADTGSTIRLATFNIWHDAEDWSARLPLLVAALRKTNADAIALQEVLQDSRKGLPNQAQTIADLLGGHSVHFTSTAPPEAPSRYGNAILTRLPVVAEESHQLEPRNDYRTALRVRVLAHGKPFDVATTHLAWQPDAASVRTQQIADLLAWLPKGRVPLVLMGDFNAQLDAPELRPLLQRFASALPPGATSTTLNPAKGHAGRVIDHILADRRSLIPAEARRIGDRSEGGEFPSDHFGVAAVLRII